MLIAGVLILTGCQQHQTVQGGQAKVGAFSVTTPAAISATGELEPLTITGQPGFEFVPGDEADQQD